MVSCVKDNRGIEEHRKHALLLVQRAEDVSLQSNESSVNTVAESVR